MLSMLKVQVSFLVAEALTGEKFQFLFHTLLDDGREVSLKMSPKNIMIISGNSITLKAPIFIRNDSITSDVSNKKTLY